ncbi:MAG: response regulator [Candidatus Binatia bacterium]
MSISAADHSVDTMTGPSVIIVEDNFLVADSLRWLLENDGYKVVGLAGSLERAAALIDEVAFDLAVLDVDLHGNNVAPVARRLVERSKPFMFLTGYADVGDMSTEFADVPRLEKPADPARILAVLGSISSTSP